MMRMLLPAWLGGALLLLLAPALLHAQLDPQSAVSRLNALDQAFASPRQEERLRIVAELRPDTAARGATLTLRVAGRLTPGDYIYTAAEAASEGPGATRIEVAEPPLHAVGAPRESAPQRIDDAVFDLHLDVHREAFWIEQDFRIPDEAGPGPLMLQGALVYRICDGLVCSAEQRLPFSVLLRVR